MPPLQPLLTHHEATVNGIRLHYVEAGRGPLVVLLHGFPEFWYSWRHQIPALAAAGYRVVAPDMRGFNESEKPPGVNSYRITALVEDVVGLFRHAGEEHASLAGHDWGGVVAWYVAMRCPDVVSRLVILNAPHPGIFLRELRTLGQLRRSWYMFFFQLPWLPEAVYRAIGPRLLRRTFRNDPVRPDAFTSEDVQRYLGALAQPGAVTAGINYYRAIVRRGPWKMRHQAGRIHVPTLVIWGEQDRYLGIRLTEGLEHWVPDIRVERIHDASHWIQQDAPDRVSELMADFLQG